MVTRKLRRRHYEPLPTVEKRRKVAPLSSLVYVLEESEVDEDIKMIFKSKVSTPGKNPPPSKYRSLPWVLDDVCFQL